MQLLQDNEGDEAVGCRPRFEFIEGDKVGDVKIDEESVTKRLQETLDLVRSLDECLNY